MLRTEVLRLFRASLRGVAPRTMEEVQRREMRASVRCEFDASKHVTDEVGLKCAGSHPSPTS